MKAVAGYVRISDSKGRDVSPDRQWSQIQEHATALGLPAPVKYYDKDRSGGDSDRPQWVALMRDLRKGLLEVVITYDQDRLFRDVEDAAAFRKACVSHDVRVFLVHGGELDFGTTGGRWQFGIKALAAEEYRHDIAEKTRRAIAHKRECGEKLGGQTPYGYMVEVRNGIKILVKDPYEQSVIAYMLAHKARGESIRGIAQRLANEGILTKTGAKWWGLTTIARIMAREAEE